MTATLDPTRSGKFPIYFNAESSPKYASVRFNTKPKLTTSKGTTTKIHSTPNNSSAVTLKVQGDHEKTQLTYDGRRKAVRTSYLLSFDPAQQKFTLDPLASEYNFNLISTQEETDTKTLREKHKQIELDDDTQGSANGKTTSVDEDEATAPVDEDEHVEPNGPDPNNPFDYRNHIGVTPSPQTQPTSVSSPTYTKQTRGPTSAPVSASDNASAARPRRQEASNPLRAAPPRRRKSLSKIRTQRRPSTRDAPDININPPTATSPHAPCLASRTHATDSSDAELDAVASDIEAAFDDDTNDSNGNGDGGLTLDFDTGVVDGTSGRRSQRNLGFLTPQAGPISLRNAASMSPTSVAARSPVKQGDAWSGYEEDDEDEDGREDVDVDDLVLGSPAQKQDRKSKSQPTLISKDVEMADDDDDEDNEFEKEMEKALENDDMDEDMQDGPANEQNRGEQNRGEESEEESEEE